jgi:transposase
LWARELIKLGHTVRLIPPAYVKPYVKRQKNDAADAEVICEAVARPNMRFVPIKSEAQQSACMLHRTRALLVKQRTMLLNAVRAHLAELGLAAGAGVAQSMRLVQSILRGDLPIDPAARSALAPSARLVVELDDQISGLEKEITRWHQASDVSQLLKTIPGVGVISASALVAMAPDPKSFESGRHFAAWLGLVPRQNSSGGKIRLGRITKAGNPYLRQMLVLGATAVLRFLREGKGAPNPWAVKLLERRPPKVAAIALANKIARVAWAMKTSGATYELRVATAA